jgi:hypothetical protein
MVVAAQESLRRAGADLPSSVIREALAASAQVREAEALCGCGRPGEYEQADGMACNKYMRCKSAAKPVPAAQVNRHVRHIGGSLLAIYENDSFIRDIGPTPGWDFQDRDEFIVRYNAHADHARIVAELEELCRFRIQTMNEQRDRAEQAEASLATCQTELQFKAALVHELLPYQNRAIAAETLLTKPVTVGLDMSNSPDVTFVVVRLGDAIIYAAAHDHEGMALPEEPDGG